MNPSPSTGVILQMVAQNHDQSESGHKRLREDVRALERHCETLEAAQGTLAIRVARLETTPIGADKVTFSGRQMAAIVGTCIVMAGSMWTLKVGIDDVRSLVENAAKLEDERNETQKEELKQLKAAIEMRRVEIQNVNNLVQQLGARR